MPRDHFREEESDIWHRACQTTFLMCALSSDAHTGKITDQCSSAKEKKTLSDYVFFIGNVAS